jgi:hypothetical protein
MVRWVGNIGPHYTLARRNPENFLVSYPTHPLTGPVFATMV